MSPQHILAQPLTLTNGSVLNNRIRKTGSNETMGHTDKPRTPHLDRLCGGGVVVGAQRLVLWGFGEAVFQNAAVGKRQRLCEDVLRGH